MTTKRITTKLRYTGRKLQRTVNCWMVNQATCQFSTVSGSHLVPAVAKNSILDACMVTNRLL